ncbi:hypothetical protein [Novosphingobium panipatense]|uniref:Uncharacterized protein n=1 Tax=Novosphingobium panipatense TaxID=428991 RepID=A0ABY1Q3U5_9SPHN|nr:hypothetical protein [Novosphingobium panipatense]SMP58526.1 hypothetical protein SAMN06296065_102489 [Novosphingobium panipatense]
MDEIETICANSYRNFHTRGFDYLCLSRTPELTRKVYFFEGDLHDLPELVIPHDHRYPFVTTVLSGAVANRIYVGLPNGPHPSVRSQWEDQTEVFDHFEYRTPLNGGDGFTWAGERRLWGPEASRTRTRGEHWRSSETDIHTLDIRCEGTVILLEQLSDVLPEGIPTNAYRRVGDRTPPSLDGLYDRMTPDHARIRINQFLDLVGNR